MISFVVIGNGMEAGGLGQTLTALKQVQPDKIVLIDETAPAASWPAGIDFISSAANPLGRCLAAALEHIASETVVILDAGLAPQREDLSRIISEIRESGRSGLTYLPLSAGENIIDIADLALDNLAYEVCAASSVPALCWAVPRNLLTSARVLEAENGPELFLLATVAVLAAAESITCLPEPALITARQAERLRPAPQACARALRMVVDSCNIEELFPNHAWLEHEQESAAAAYHTLAALFLRLEDRESALECLELGDRLEDSPRSLALKGLIAFERGEDLAAVANMVSSLQQYERRKKDAGHYISFKPMDIEQINCKLNLGLKALNSRDNSGAAAHFAAAVFNFDPFFRDFGIDRLAPAVQQRRNY